MRISSLCNDMVLSVENQDEFEWNVMDALSCGRASKNPYYVISDGVLLRVKDHKANWANFIDDYGNSAVNCIVSVNVGNRSDGFRHDKSGSWSERKFNRTFPDMRTVEYTVENGEHLSDSVKNIKFVLDVIGVDNGIRITDSTPSDFEILSAKVRGFIPNVDIHDIDSEYDDLLLRKTDQSDEFVNSLMKYGSLKRLIIVFRSDYDGDLWYRIKFGNVFRTVKPTGWAIERRTDFSMVTDSVNVVRLYHNTTLDGLDGILYDMEISNDKIHSEGHGRMVWFSDRLGDYDRECTISIKVPVEEIGNGKFKKMNESHYVSYNSIDLTNYDFEVVKIAGHTIELIEEMVVNITNIVKSEGVEDYMVENEVYDRLIRYIGIYNNESDSYPSIIEYIEKVIFGWDLVE